MKGTPTLDDDQYNVRFRSTIEYPAFLLHVLKVVNNDDEEQEGQLDDKRLIKQFDEAVQAMAGGDTTRWVHNFAINLLRCRNLFDSFILKRQDTATSGDDGDWSLQRLLKRTSKAGQQTPGYINTFSRSDAEVEEDGDVDAATNELLVLQSMLRVTYTSPRTMHWITKVLKLVSGKIPREVSGSEVADLLRSYARERVRPFFEDDHPDGFDINRIVFTYLDYLLLADHPTREFKFSFRNSIEHFYPQYPTEEQSGEVVSPSYLNCLGNLALVSVSANSKFSNSLPKAKAENYRSTIETQSPKLHAMAEITRAEGWGDEQVVRHHDAMLELLGGDVLCA
jgi:hypothetical protein